MNVVSESASDIYKDGESYMTIIVKIWQKKRKWKSPCLLT